MIDTNAYRFFQTEHTYTFLRLLLTLRIIQLFNIQLRLFLANIFLYLYRDYKICGASLKSINKLTDIGLRERRIIERIMENFPKKTLFAAFNILSTTEKTQKCDVYQFNQNIPRINYHEKKLRLLVGLLYIWKKWVELLVVATKYGSKNIAMLIKVRDSLTPREESITSHT